MLLSKSDITQLLTFDECLEAVENAFRLYAEGQTLKPELMHVDAPPDGEFHVKAGGLNLTSGSYFALKANGGFFRNRELYDLPNIQGSIILTNAANGYPLAIMDSTEITRQRTGAATAIAAKYLARQNSTVAVVCGSGNQARIQLKSLARVLPLEKALVFGRNKENAQKFAEEMSEELGFDVLPSFNLGDCLENADVCVTCTPAKNYFLKKEDVPPGMFIAAVGADSPDKQELEPALLRSAKVVADVLEQSIHVGEVNHAIKNGLMKKADVYGELGEIIAGKKRGRASSEEIIIFDSTGTAFQDAAAAAIVYEKAIETGRGTTFDLYQ